MTGRTTIDLRLAMMSDFHCADLDDVNRALTMIDDALDPDLGVDHIIIGGDIVDRAQQGLLEQFADGLKRHKCLGRATAAIGNHDCFPASKNAPWTSAKDLIFGPCPTDRYEEFCRLFAGGRGRRGGRRLMSNDDYPFGRVLGENVVIAALDSTRNGTLDPREWAAGELREEEIAAVGAFFEEHAKARHKLIVMHHSPWTPYHEGERESFPMGMAEPDATTAVRWLEQIGTTLVLCGHWHELGGVVKRKKLGARMFGFRAGTAGDAEGTDGVCVYHVIDLLESGRYTVSARAFSREELE